MNWPSEMQAGFVYAAIACDDPSLLAASPGLTSARIHELSLAGPAPSERRAALPGLLAHFVRPLCAPSALPSRMRAILGGSLPAPEARAWLRGAAMPRPGFRADAGLRAWLRQFAEHARRAEER